MDPWMLIGSYLHTAGLLTFGGGFIWFILVFARADRHADEAGQNLIDDIFRYTSTAMSIGLTCVMLGGLLRYYLIHGEYRWGLATLNERLFLAKMACFLILWGFWGWFEIVVMTPFRTLAPKPGEAPNEGYLLARRRMRVTMKRLLLVFSMVLLCASAAQAARYALAQHPVTRSAPSQP